MAELRDPSRRKLFRIASAGSLALGMPRTAAGQAAAAPPTYAFFTPAEAAFIEAAVARLIPRDELGPGAIEAGVPHYIDRQLAGAWGAGERLYRSGPWREGEETQGYQLPFTPAQLFRHALRAIDSHLAARGAFARLAPAEQDRFLKALEEGEVKLEPVPAKVFFEHLLDATVEGFFCDPAHGGNVGMVGWRLIGFPGAYASYYDAVDRYGEKFAAEPVGMSAHAAHGHR
jgi:gluconate 2-dehydrogenase gamma chain